MTFVYALDHRHELAPDAILALVGGKAANLGVMTRDLDLPVPPGFVITTEACRAFLAGGWPADLDDEIQAAMERVGATLGRGFGDPDDPLLVSVRSGAPVSMPGMMDTILDLGVTDRTEPGLARSGGGPAFARDCRERLRGQFRALVGSEPPDDPWLQLRLAIEAVFRSWQGERARAYRSRESIPDDLGTAATVQAMVFGNRDPISATGVLFTRNPATGERTPYGDVLFGAQGEDVVAGTHRTEPVAALDERLHDAAEELRTYADRLERHYADMCDIEFTIESGRLWMLQVRVGKRSPQAALRMAVEMADDPGFPLAREAAVRRVLPLLGDPPVVTTLAGGHDVAPLTTGLAASPGIASGEIVTSPDEAVRIADEGRELILVRAETSPDDVHGMARAAGILTARGGIASHAALVARGWGIPAVVGADEVAVGATGISVGSKELSAGETLTIDGTTGAVYRGRLAAKTDVVPAAKTLLEWSAALGIAVPGTSGGGASTSEEGVAAPGAGERVGAGERGGAGSGTDDTLRMLGVKGFVTAEGGAEALGVAAEDARAALYALVAAGLAVASAGAYRLSDTGKQRAAQLTAEERTALGAEAAGALLEGLLVLDARVKDVVTAWQLREDAPGSEPTINDHSDAAYDEAVLDRLRALGAEADAWLADASRSLPRLGTYRRRIGRAVEAAGAGDQRYVASPRVDSFHGVWFELHEELIVLAGRTRADEVAAGRA